MSKNPKGPALTTPKHGKKFENRLYSTARRGSPKKADQEGGMNPDGSIEVAAVCGDEVRIYDKVKHGRRRLETLSFSHHGSAVLYATEHDQNAREARARVGS